MITCPKCQTQNPDLSRFCNNCGKELPDISKPVLNRNSTCYDILDTFHSKVDQSSQAIGVQFVNYKKQLLNGFDPAQYNIQGNYALTVWNTLNQIDLRILELEEQTSEIVEFFTNIIEISTQDIDHGEYKKAIDKLFSEYTDLLMHRACAFKSALSTSDLCRMAFISLVRQ